VGPIFTFRSDIPVGSLVWLWLLPCRWRPVLVWWLFACWGWFPGVLSLSVGCVRVVLVTGAGFRLV
jgi:hypothetical protein